MTLNKDTFTGEYSYSIDAKGRLNIPAKFRQALSEENQNTFVITQGMDPCIYVYPPIEWQKIESELKGLSALPAINRAFIRSKVRYASFTPFDKQGRIQLTGALIEYAQLNKDALIIGMVNKIELWNPVILDKVTQQHIDIDPGAYEQLSEKITI